MSAHPRRHARIGLGDADVHVDQWPDAHVDPLPVADKLRLAVAVADADGHGVSDGHAGGDSLADAVSVGQCHSHCCSDGKRVSFWLGQPLADAHANADTLGLADSLADRHADGFGLRLSQPRPFCVGWSASARHLSRVGRPPCSAEPRAARRWICGLREDLSSSWRRHGGCDW